MNETFSLSAGLPELRERNEIRLQEAKERLGTKWLLHPKNSVDKPKEKRKYTRRTVTE